MNLTIKYIHRTLNEYRKYLISGNNKYNFARSTDKHEAELLKAELTGIANTFRYMDREMMSNYIFRKIYRYRIEINDDNVRKSLLYTVHKNWTKLLK